ncbi:MAG: hypothetical protein HY600_05585 [Candidatus Omnitrophica bacterium]|nr:hypothetical protein [Candidatus Omnitrophota bacterium]
MTRTEQLNQVRERAIRVYRYVIRGFNASEIAKLEGLSLRQAYWYVEEGGRILGGDLKRMAQRGILRELFAAHQERKKELWLTYSSTRQGAVKVSCMNRLAEEDKWLVDLAERLKLIDQKAEEQKVDVSLEHRIAYDRHGLISRLRDLESRLS